MIDGGLLLLCAAGLLRYY